MALNLITIVLTAFAISIETVVETGFGMGNPSIPQKNRYHKKAYFMVFLGWISYVLGFGFHNCGFAFYGEHNGIIYSVFIVFEVFTVGMSIYTLHDFWNTSEQYIHDD
ncbi:unnamed protein product [Lactuca virosa]|uniref:Uncharacterized protein n=1 Tax=Lactuca virosa TaxID=75947 RepID=A0AAU9LPG3_9ASTR|nr:unnamed protein product [Lactuca virosa]